ncbi:hypothetical protein D3C72_2110630 [compost metagenome]
MQAGTGRDLAGVVTGDATHLALAGAFHHQQRNRAGGACLEHEQPVELEGADQQGRCGEHFAEQLGDGFRVGVLGQHMGVARAQGDHFTAHVGVVEEKALSEVEFGHSDGP